MPKPLADKPGRTYSAGYALLRTQEQLPAYELDPSSMTRLFANELAK